MTRKLFNLYQHQSDFVHSEDRFPSLVAGYGAGKTYSLCIRALKQCGLNAGKIGLLAEPVYPMVKDVLQPTWEEILNQSGYKFDYSASDLKYRVFWKTGWADVILRSAENYRRWAGLNLAFGGIDEGDLLKDDGPWKMLLSRLRDGNTLSAFVTTTPEGFNWVWKYWQDDIKTGYSKIQASTHANKHLKNEYIEALEENYDDQLIKAYLHGEFVNLQQGQTYYAFDRETNVKPVEYDKHRPVKIGMDFNVDPITCVLVQEYYEHPKIRVFGEIELRHTGGQELMTQQICNEINRRIKNRITVYPDPAGKQRRTSAMNSDHDIILSNGFELIAKTTAPIVSDRVNAVNSAMKSCIIDPSCTGLIRDLEQVSNKEGTREIDKSNKELTHFSDGFGYYIDYEHPVHKPETRTYIA